MVLRRPKYYLSEPKLRAKRGNETDERRVDFCGSGIFSFWAGNAGLGGAAGAGVAGRGAAGGGIGGFGVVNLFSGGSESNVALPIVWIPMAAVI